MKKKGTRKKLRPNPVRYRDRQGRFVSKAKAMRLKSRATTEITAKGKRPKTITTEIGYRSPKSKEVHAKEAAFVRDSVTKRSKRAFDEAFYEAIGEEYAEFLNDFPELEDLEEIDYLSLQEDDEDFYIPESR